MVNLCGRRMSPPSPSDLKAWPRVHFTYVVGLVWSYALPPGSVVGLKRIVISPVRTVARIAPASVRVPVISWLLIVLRLIIISWLSKRATNNRACRQPSKKQSEIVVAAIIATVVAPTIVAAVAIAAVRPIAPIVTPTIISIPAPSAVVPPVLDQLDICGLCRRWVYRRKCISWDHTRTYRNPRQQKDRELLHFTHHPRSAGKRLKQLLCHFKPAACQCERPLETSGRNRQVRAFDSGVGRSVDADMVVESSKRTASLSIANSAPHTSWPCSDRVRLECSFDRWHRTKNALLDGRGQLRKIRPGKDIH